MGEISLRIKKTGAGGGSVDNPEGTMEAGSREVIARKPSDIVSCSGFINQTEQIDCLPSLSLLLGGRELLNYLCDDRELHHSRYSRSFHQAQWDQKEPPRG